jgi:hypothetical protein
MKNVDLLEGFEVFMDQSDTPVTPIADRRQGPGRHQRAYAMGDKTINARTNAKPALMAAHYNREAGSVLPIDAPLPFEGYDYVAAIFRKPKERNRAVVYLIPSEVAAAEMKKNQNAWLQMHDKHSKDNRLFVIRFDAAGKRAKWNGNCGYAEKWSQYYLGEFDLSVAPPTRRRNAMHCLENSLLVTSVAVEHDELSKAELVRNLRALASASHEYSPDGEESPAIVALNESLNQRFGDLMVGGEGDEE